MTTSKGKKTNEKHKCNWIKFILNYLWIPIIAPIIILWIETNNLKNNASNFKNDLKRQDSVIQKNEAVIRHIDTVINIIENRNVAPSQNTDRGGNNFYGRDFEGGIIIGHNTNEQNNQTKTKTK